MANSRDLSFGNFDLVVYYIKLSAECKVGVALLSLFTSLSQTKVILIPQRYVRNYN